MAAIHVLGRHVVVPIGMTQIQNVAILVIHLARIHHVRIHKRDASMNCRQNQPVVVVHGHTGVGQVGVMLIQDVGTFVTQLIGVVVLAENHVGQDLILLVQQHRWLQRLHLHHQPHHHRHLQHQLEIHAHIHIDVV